MPADLKLCLILALLLLSPGALLDEAQASQFLTTELTIQSSAVKLAANLLTPEVSNGNGIVMLPGSGPAERASMLPAAEQLVRSGSTVLIFDKRGSGQSGGNWIRSSLDDLAGDAIAAMAVLREQESVRNVGLWAHSQGNWVATRAAELGAKPAFLIAVSGGGISPLESEMYSYRHAVSGLPVTEQYAAMALVQAYFNYLAGDMSRADLDVLVESAVSTNWYQQLDIENVLVSEGNRPNWQWVADYDPGLAAAGRLIPTLVILGGADHSIPLEPTVAAWNAQLAASAAANSRIVILVGRDHHLRNADSGHGHGVSSDGEVWGVINQWLVESEMRQPKTN